MATEPVVLPSDAVALHDLAHGLELGGLEVTHTVLKAGVLKALESRSPRVDSVYLRFRKAFSAGPIKSATSQSSPLASFSSASSVG